MNPGYYAIIPADVRYDSRLKANAKLLYGEITSLTQKDGYCWAENSYFAELYNVDPVTISRWISQLVSYEYIEVELLKSEGNKRKITIDKKINTYRQKRQEVLIKKSRGIDEKVNSIYENNKNNIKTNREKNALDFFKNNFPSAYEIFCMQYKSKIKDFQHFEKMFELKSEEEELKYEQKVIKARLERFAINYIAVEEKQSKVIPINSQQPVNNEPAYRDVRF